MGRLRASLPQLVGVKFNRDLALDRLIALGLTEPKVINGLLKEMQAAYERQAFIQAINSPKRPVKGV